MTKLNQIIAVEQGVGTEAKRSFTDAHRDTQKDGPLSGISRTYTRKYEDGDEFPPERTRVQYTVDELNNRVAKALGRYFDVTATKDWANTEARADVVVDGDVIIECAPVTYLLWLEKRLQDLWTYFDKLPTLDPAEEWAWDAQSNAYRSATIETTKTRKIPKVLELSPATEQHPAQVTTFTIDEVIGTWSTFKLSGAIPASRRAELLERTSKLREAVKSAREKANDLVVTDVLVSDDIFRYLLG